MKEKSFHYKVFIERAFEIIAIILTLLISNRRSWLCIYEINKPLFWCEYGDWVQETIWYIVILGIILWIAYRKSLINALIDNWRRNWLLVCFLLLGVLSFVWSTNTVGTLQRVLQVSLTAFIGGYLGTRYQDKDLISIMIWFSVCCLIASYLLIITIPGAAIMSIPPHTGAWRGAFSHRNYTGSILAYESAVFLILLLIGLVEKSKMKILFSLSMIVFSFVFIFFTKSATGIILVFLLNSLVVFWYFLQAWKRKVKKIHYFALGGVLLTTALIIVTNLDRLLGALGRNVTLTGRIPLWIYLVDVWRESKMWLGFGLGTIWTFLDFRLQAATDLGWNVQIINAHNGYLDILLYLGLLGLSVFLLIVVQSIVRTARYYFESKTIESVWVVITLVYVLVVNITVSFFFEFETFHWILFVVVLFLTTPRKAKTTLGFVSAGSL